MIKQRSTYVLALLEPDFNQPRTLSNVLLVDEMKKIVWEVEVLDWGIDDYYKSLDEWGGFSLDSKNGLKCQLEVKTGKIEFVFKGFNFLNKETGKVIFSVPHEIQKCLKVQGKYVVMMVGKSKLFGSFISNNVWCIDETGRKKWEISDRATIKKYDSSSNIYFDHGKLFTVSGAGMTSEVDINSGEILGQEFTK